ncbi:VanZ family protein [Streptomyces sp. NPDC001068]|uniref:VanZ family protein n=1 Tax=Streptomyces sp. NPDC001068 TaxID=3364544 RepID=UPI0036B83E09
MSLWQVVLWVTPATTISVLLAAPFPVAALLLVARRHRAGVSVIGRTVLASCLLLVIAATFSMDYGTGGSGRLESGALAYFLDGGRNLGGLEKDMVVREALANILMFTPFASLIGLSWRRLGPWVALCGGVALSFLIEFSQLVLGGGRVADVDDFVLNSLGAGIGVLIFTAAEKLAEIATAGDRVRLLDRTAVPPPGRGRIGHGGPGPRTRSGRRRTRGHAYQGQYRGASTEEHR